MKKMETFKSKVGEVRLSATSGHVCIVGEDWTEVVEALVPEALKKGLIPKSLYDEAAEEVRLQAAKDVQTNPGKDTEREAAIVEALDQLQQMVDSGESATVGGNKLIHNGNPMVGAVSELAGFKVSVGDIEQALK